MAVEQEIYSKQKCKIWSTPIFDLPFSSLFVLRVAPRLLQFQLVNGDSPKLRVYCYTVISCLVSKIVALLLFNCAATVLSVSTSQREKHQ
jgi:hypothetical protein